jgi:hypothetical protein
MNPQTTTELTAVTDLWNSLLPYEAPDRFTLALWLRQHGLAATLYAVEQVAIKRVKNEAMDRQHAIRLCSAICCSESRLKKHQQNAA